MAVNRVDAPPAPDGTIDRADRTLISIGYGGISAIIQQDPLWRRRNSASGAYESQGDAESSAWKEQDDVSGDWTKN